MALTINQTCLDNTTLQIIQDNYTMICQDGCDNVTNSCNPQPYQQNLIIIIIIIVIIYCGWRFIKWVDNK